MLFEKVKKKHILQGIKNFEEKGLPKEFGASSTYDVVFQDKKFPPKAIMAYANFHAEGRKIERYFKGGLGTDCFNAFERNGFIIEKKNNSMKILYKKYEKSVYNWLKNKNEKDANFTFSLRQNGSKGAELDYFIGTEKSRYFGVTFWTIPVGFPGSSGDCIDLIFKLNKNYTKYSYDFKFSQTNSPDGKQNQSALNLVSSLALPISEKIGAARVSDDSHKMFTIRTKPKKDSYTDLAEMLLDVEKDLFTIIELVNTAIASEKRINLNFEAHRITKEEFANMEAKLLVRFNKYGSLQNSNDHSENIREQFSKWLKGNESSNKINSYLRAIDILNETQKRDIYLENDLSKLNIFYKDLIENQKDVNGKYYYESAPSYGNNGFYSAAVKSFIDFSNDDTNTFQKTRAKLEPAIFDDYINFLRFIIKELGLKPNDQRVVYSVRGYSLNFTIGQKYCLNVYTSKTKENFGVISIAKLSDNSEQYAGKSPLTYYSYLDDLSLNEFQKSGVIQAIKSMLQKTNKSGYSKSNDLEFESYVFDTVLKENFHKKNMKPKNQILYGPPGTGKTYKTKELAVQISNPSFIYDTNWSIVERRTEIVKEYDSLCEKGQIVFTTFHQSMSYEDFVEGIKPTIKEDDDEKELGYDIQDGIFKALCKKANKKIIASVDYQDNTTPFDIAWNKLIDSVKNELTEGKLLKIGSWEYGLSSKESLKYESLNSPSKYTFTITKKNIYDTYQNKLARPSGAFQKDMKDILNFIKSEFQLNDFKEILNQKEKQPDQNYLLIIDEINRGNVSAIFGELITLLEDDKRIGQKEAIKITLPYSKDEFGVPSNLYIIGTMNTADRSVEALDTALRRRFEFKEMMPDYTVINNEEVENIKLSEVLKTINERIELLIDRDHTIGHSYFVGVNTKKKLANAFNNKIVPLLQEYFYGDYGKIGLVLGKGFVEKIKNNEINFANFEYENAEDFKTSSYSLKLVNSNSIIEAILELLGKTAVI